MLAAAARTLRTTPEPPYRVMLVDDSATARGIFRRTLESDRSIAVVAAVGDDDAAAAALAACAPEVVVLDVEMPAPGRLGALTRLLAADPSVKVLMASALTAANAAVSLEALATGAADYIPKPAARQTMHAAEAFQRELLEKVKALGRARRGEPHAAESPPPPGLALRQPSACRPGVVCIGSSTGGPQSLSTCLGGLGRDFPLPVLIAQHLPGDLTALLAQHLLKAGGRACGEASDGEPIEPGRSYIAPGSLHMRIAREAGKPVIRLDDGPKENRRKPAVDALLRSAAATYGPEALAVLLSGIGRDGLAGARQVAEAGGTVLAQDAATSVVWDMPGAAAEAGLCSAILPVAEIAGHVWQLTGRSAA